MLLLQFKFYSVDEDLIFSIYGNKENIEMKIVAEVTGLVNYCSQTWTFDISNINIMRERYYNIAVHNTFEPLLVNIDKLLTVCCKWSVFRILRVNLYIYIYAHISIETFLAHPRRPSLPNSDVCLLEQWKIGKTQNFAPPLMYMSL